MTTIEVPVQVWRWAANTRTGTSHVRDDLPGQDRLQCEVVDSVHGQVLISVVSDGAGSATESAAGAEHICTKLSQRLAAGLNMLEPDTAAEWLRDHVTDVRDSLLRHAEEASTTPREYAATMLCAVLAKDWAVFAQVGDGAIVFPGSSAGEWAYAFWPQRGEYANTTSFLTDANALDKLQVTMLRREIPEVALLTDGLQGLVLHYADRTVFGTFFEQMMAPVRDSDEAHEDHPLSEGLHRYLGSPVVVARADDDLTLVLASRLSSGNDNSAQVL